MKKKSTNLFQSHQNLIYNFKAFFKNLSIFHSKKIYLIRNIKVQSCFNQIKIFLTIIIYKYSKIITSNIFNNINYLKSILKNTAFCKNYQIIIFSLGLFFYLESCGFQVVYKDQHLSSSISNELAAIKINKDRTHLSQQLRNNLYDALNPDYIKTENKYFLILTLKKSVSSTFITSTGASGRNKTSIIVEYELKNSKNLQKISSGTLESSDNYDVSINRYGTHIAEQYVENNITKLLAQSIRNSLINDLIEFQKRCSDQVKIDDDSACKFIERTDTN